MCGQTLDNNKELIQAISKLTGVLLIFFITCDTHTTHPPTNAAGPTALPHPQRCHIHSMTQRSIAQSELVMSQPKLAMSRLWFSVYPAGTASPPSKQSSMAASSQSRP